MIIQLHRHGINIRYLGLIRSHLTSNSIRKLLLTEIISRVIKNNIKSKMREIKSSYPENYKKIVVDFLNNILTTDENFIHFWKKLFLPSIFTYFRKESLTLEEIENPIMIQKTLNYDLLFSRISILLGIKFKIEFLRKIKETNFLLPIKLIIYDIEELLPVVKCIHRIFFEEGTILSKLACKNRIIIIKY